MPRSPWIIWRSTSIEVLRTLVLAAVALVTLIAFIGAVRPLADGRIGLMDALRLFTLLAVPMLQFALPFAAGFAATIGYHRAASENEITAAHAAGLAHRTLLLPAAAIGIVLAGTLWLLTNYTIPYFLDRAEGLIQRDIARIVLAPLARGEAIRIGNFDIHADRAVGPMAPPAGSSANAYIALFGVLAVQNSDKDGISYASDERVDLWLFDDPEDASSTVVQFAFTRPEFVSPTGSLSVRALLSRPYRIPRSVKDDPKFLSYPDLLRLRDNPDRSATINSHTRALAARAASVAMLDHIAATLASGKPAEFTLPEGPIAIAGARLVPQELGAILVPTTEAGRIVITSRLSTRDGTQTQWATSGRLGPTETSGPKTGAAESPTLTLELRDVTTLDPDGRVNTPKESESFRLLSPIGFDAKPILTLPAATLLERAATAPVLTKDANALRGRIASLIREIDSKLHERAAYAASCLIMVLLGGVMAIRLRDAMLLPVYLWSFLPALAAVISISAGQGVAHEQGLVGYFILWGGVAILALITFTQFLALRKH